MAQQTLLVVGFQNMMGQGWVVFDDVSGDLISLRLVNTSPDRTIVFNAQRGTRPVQSFTAQPGSDTTFQLPTGQQQKYTFTKNADGSWQEAAFTTWVSWG